MSKRIATAIGLIVFGIPVLMFGGIPYFLLVGLLLAAAAWEYADMFQAAGSRPARWLIVAGVVVIAAGRFFHATNIIPVLTIGILALMVFHLVDYERGAEHAGMDFSVSLGALVYIGWVGAYLFDLRQLEFGGWWVMFVLPCVWLADTGAYALGAAYGKHYMRPRLSP